MLNSDPVQRFLDSVVDPAIGFADVFGDGVVLDATVPNWRFTTNGADAVTGVLGGWFASPASFVSLSRTPLPDGELVQFDLSWEESGTPYACHQAHVLTVAGDRVVRDIAWCGGRWSAAAVAEMEAASLSTA